MSLPGWTRGAKLGARLGVIAALAASATSSGCRKGGGSDAPDGERIYRSMCGRCHGGDGSGGVPAAQGLPAPRNFRDPVFQDSRSDADLKNVIVHGRAPSMPPFGTAFEPAELDALVRQIRRFDPRHPR